MDTLYNTLKQHIHTYNTYIHTLVSIIIQYKIISLDKPSERLKSKHIPQNSPKKYPYEPKTQIH